MELTQRNKIIIGIISVLVLLSIYIAFDRRSKSNAVPNDDSMATTTVDNSDVSTQGTGDYTIEPVDFDEGPSTPIPDLNRPVTSSSYAVVAPEALSVASSNIKILQDKLKKDPSDFSSWIDLGISQKQAGDYDGAVISWTYASKIAPSDFISLGNLGDLYAYFLKDNTKAESYYKQAIANGPTQVNLYTQLADVYVYLFNDKSKALSIINEGLAKVPNDPNLLQVKAQLNK